MCKPIRKIDNLMERLMNVIDYEVFKKVEFNTFYKIEDLFNLTCIPYGDIQWLHQPDNHNFKSEFSI